MKKILLVFFALLIIMKMFVGCGINKSVYELALITDFDILEDKSFNQAAWEGLKKYADEHNKTFQYYQPSEGTNKAYLESIELAVKSGAKVIVTPGSLFAVTIYQAQVKYPEVKFILLDGEPHTEDYKTYHTEKNVLPILYSEEEAGFMAGYAAVKDGFTKLGFQGDMAVPYEIRYGHGFAQGAEVAAEELELAEGSVSLMYNYSGDFSSSSESKARAVQWYKDGTEVILACTDAASNSVIAAADEVGGKFVIGVNVDQYDKSESVISSAVKMLGNSVYKALEKYYNGNWEGGETWVLDAASGGIGLVMDSAKWRKFSVNDYNILLKKVQEKEYIINKRTDIGLTDLGLKYVNVTQAKE